MKQVGEGANANKKAATFSINCYVVVMILVRSRVCSGSL